jgi:hypothetical protein
VLRTRTEWLNAIAVDLDWNLVVLLGLSVTSFITSPIALSVKAQQQVPAPEVREVSQSLGAAQDLPAGSVATVGRVVTKAAPRDARLADLIKGEEVDNATTVDLTRFQMFVITLIVVIGYAGVLIVLMRTGPSPLTALPYLS